MSTRQPVGIVGGGRAGLALAIALGRVGWPVAAVSSRDGRRRAAIASALPGTLVVARPAEVAAVADLVLLAVPDDAIGVAARDLHARPGALVAHLSGVHPAGVLRPGVSSEVLVGAFHPLVAFADVERAVDALRGAWVAVDGDAAAIAELAALAEALGARPVVLGGSGVTADAVTADAVTADAVTADAVTADAVTAKAAHHAAAVLAAGGFVALLDVVAELGRVAGLDEARAVEVYGSLMSQGLANASALGVAAALTGPVARGDTGTLRLHLDAISRVAPDVRELYLATARRQLAIARERGTLDAHRIAAIASELGPGDVEPDGARGCDVQD